MARRPRPPGGPSAYQRRIERGIAAGKTRQQARGHKAAEHVDRRREEQRQAASLGKLTTYQRGEIRRYAREQAKRDLNERDFDYAYDRLVEIVSLRGWKVFLAMRRLRNEMNRRYIRGGGTRPFGKKRKGDTSDIKLQELNDALQRELGEDYRLQLDDIYLIFYH